MRAKSYFWLKAFCAEGLERLAAFQPELFLHHCTEMCLMLHPRSFYSSGLYSNMSPG